MTKRMQKSHAISRKLKINFLGKENLVNKLKKVKIKNNSKSLFSTRLKARQALKAFYSNLSYKQLKAYVTISRKTNSTWKYFVLALESRIDTLLIRSQFANSFRHSRQLINHSKYYLNNQYVSIPSLSVNTGSLISVNKLGITEFNINKVINKRWLYGSPITKLDKLKLKDDSITKFIYNQSVGLLFDKIYTVKLKWLDKSSIKNSNLKPVFVNENNRLFLKQSDLIFLLINNKSFVIPKLFNNITQKKEELYNILISLLRYYNSFNIMPYVYNGIYLEIDSKLLTSFYVKPSTAYASAKQISRYQANVQLVLENVK